MSLQVDALQGHRVMDVACGSGDAQTLCLTDEDMVWSWGDGDYGKLGRGGSDGCKVPMKVGGWNPPDHALDGIVALDDKIRNDGETIAQLLCDL